MPIPTLVLDEIASGKILHYKQAYPPHHRIKLVDGDIVALAAAMKSEYCDLRSLDLSDNEITNEGLRIFVGCFYRERATTRKVKFIAQPIDTCVRREFNGIIKRICLFK